MAFYGGSGGKGANVAGTGEAAPLKWDAGPRQTCLRSFMREIVSSPQKTPKARNYKAKLITMMAELS